MEDFLDMDLENGLILWFEEGSMIN